LYTNTIDYGTPAFDEFLSLRNEVLRKPLGLEFYAEDISQEYKLIHFCCYSDNNELLAGLVFQPNSETEIKMRQVAVSPKVQKQGVGTFLVKASEKLARQLGYETIVLSARLTAVPFYTRLDYDTISEVYQEVGIDHKKMKKDLS